MCACIYTYVCICVCIYVCICMLASMHVCIMYVWLYACMYVCMYARMHIYIRMYVCMYVCKHVFMYNACVYVCKHAFEMKQRVPLNCEFSVRHNFILPRYTDYTSLVRLKTRSGPDINSTGHLVPQHAPTNSLVLNVE